MHCDKEIYLSPVCVKNYPHVVYDMEDVELLRVLSIDSAEDVSELIDLCLLQFLPSPVCSSLAQSATLLRRYAPVRFARGIVAPVVEVALCSDERCHAGDGVERDHLCAHLAKFFIADCAPVCDLQCLPDQLVVALPAFAALQRAVLFLAALPCSELAKNVLTSILISVAVAEIHAAVREVRLAVLRTEHHQQVIAIKLWAFLLTWIWRDA